MGVPQQARGARASVPRIGKPGGKVKFCMAQRRSMRDFSAG